MKVPVASHTEVSMLRRFVALSLLLCIAALTPTGAQQDELPAPEENDAPGSAVAALAADLDVEETLLGEALARYQSLSARRGRLLTRLAELYSELDRVVQAVGAVTSLSVEAVLLQIDAAEGERSRMQATERALIESIVKSARRVDLLKEQLAELQGREKEEAGALSGVWDVVFMPLLGFDLRGFRIGMGGGFYDASLAFLGRRRSWRRPRLIGLAFEAQRVDRLPEDEWDIPLDGVLTERRYYRFDKSGSRKLEA